MYSPQLRSKAVKEFRRILSTKCEGLPQDLINKEIIPLVLGFLTNHSQPCLQVEALSGLANVITGLFDKAKWWIKNNAVPILLGLLKSDSREILEQTVWILGNIAGHDVSVRDTVLKTEALPYAVLDEKFFG